MIPGSPGTRLSKGANIQEAVMDSTKRITVEAFVRRGEFTETFYPLIENSTGRPSIRQGGAPASDEVVGVQTETPLLRDEKSTNTLELFAYGSGRVDWRYSANSYINVAERATQILKPPDLRSPEFPIVVAPDPWTIFVERNKPASSGIPHEAPEAAMKTSEISEHIWTARWHLILHSLLLVAEASVLFVCLGR
jgi:hypothetical protein